MICQIQLLRRRRRNYATYKPNFTFNYSNYVILNNRNVLKSYSTLTLFNAVYHASDNLSFFFFIFCLHNYLKKIQA